MVPDCRFPHRLGAGRRRLVARSFLCASDSLGAHHRLANRCHRRSSSRRTGRHGRCTRWGTRPRARTRHSARQPRRHVRRERDFLRPHTEDSRALDACWSPPILRSDRRADASTMGNAPGRDGTAITAVVAVFTLAVMLMLGALRTTALATAAAIAIVFAMRLFYRRWLGGVTGDSIGACGELVEIAVLV